MLSNRQLIDRTKELIGDIQSLPSRFMMEVRAGQAKYAFAKAASGGLGLTAIGYTTKSIAWPYIKQQGDMGLPEILLILGGAFCTKKLYSFVDKKTQKHDAPIFVRAGLIAGALSSALAASPFREDYNNYWASTTQEHVPAEMLAGHITDFKNEGIRTVWPHICSAISSAVNENEDIGYIVCP